MYTRKQQMEKVKLLDVKVEKICTEVEKRVTDCLAENLAEVVQFNHAVLETMREILTESQRSEFFDVMSRNMENITSNNKG